MWHKEIGLLVTSVNMATEEGKANHSSAGRIRLGEKKLASHSKLKRDERNDN
mgnify:CR=1 FL=1